MTAPNPFPFDFVLGFTKTSGVDEHERNTTNISGLFNRVPGRARYGRYDRAIVAEQLIEETGFPSVGPSDNSSANAAPEELALSGGAEQLIDKLNGRIDGPQQFSTGVGSNVL